MKSMKAAIETGKANPRMMTVYAINLFRDRQTREEVIRSLWKGVNGKDPEACLLAGFLMASEDADRARDLYQQALADDAGRNLTIFSREEVLTFCEAGADLGLVKAWFGAHVLKEADKNEDTKAMAKAFMAGANFEVKAESTQAGRKFWTEAADKGDVEAMAVAGALLWDSEPRDVVKGEWYLRKAVEKKLLKAMWMLAQRLKETNPKEAIELFKTAADGGKVDAMRDYGLLLWDGKLVKQDLREGFRYLKMAGERGDLIASVIS
jgi:TPR repeat protein